MTASDDQDPVSPESAYQQGAPTPEPLTLVVEGETFVVREREPEGLRHTYEYDWITGPNPDYGYLSSGLFEKAHEEHVSSVRDFLRHIDPTTGYLAD